MNTFKDESTSISNTRQFIEPDSNYETLEKLLKENRCYCKDINIYNLQSFGKAKGTYYYNPHNFKKLYHMMSIYDFVKSNGKCYHSLVANKRIKDKETDGVPLIIDVDYKPFKDTTIKLWRDSHKPV